MLLTTSVGSAKIANAAQQPHVKQHSNPTEMLILDVEEGKTKIVAASKFDLNAIYTPFKSPSIAKNVQEDFTIKDNIIFFQPSNEQPFSIYISEKGDPQAPTYKLTIAPSPVPVGQQIKLEPKEPYFAAETRRANKTNSDYPSTVIKMLSDTAKLIASKEKKSIDNFILDDSFDASPYYIGNALLNPSFKLKGMDYEIFVLEVVNRSNESFELVNADFASISPEIGLVESDTFIESAGVGFFPDQVIQPGGMTHVILVRGN